MIDIALLSYFFSFTLRLGEENVSLFSICLLFILKSNSLSIKVTEKAKIKKLLTAFVSVSSWSVLISNN